MKRSAWLACLALALQAMVVAPHVHLQPAAAAAHHASHALNRKAPPCRHGDGEEVCVACLALFAGSGVVPVPPAIATPAVMSVLFTLAGEASDAPAPGTACFRARAPPV